MWDMRLKIDVVSSGNWGAGRALARNPFSNISCEPSSREAGRLPRNLMGGMLFEKKGASSCTICWVLAEIQMTA